MPLKPLKPLKPLEPLKPIKPLMPLKPLEPQKPVKPVKPVKSLTANGPPPLPSSNTQKKFAPRVGRTKRPAPPPPLGAAGLTPHRQGKFEQVQIGVRSSDPMVKIKT